MSTLRASLSLFTCDVIKWMPGWNIKAIFDFKERRAGVVACQAKCSFSVCISSERHFNRATRLVRRKYDATQSSPPSFQPSPWFHFLLRKCCGPRLWSLRRENGHWWSIQRRPAEGAHVCHLFGRLQRRRHPQVRPQFLPLLHLPALGRKWR